MSVEFNKRIPNSDIRRPEKHTSLWNHSLITHSMVKSAIITTAENKFSISNTSFQSNWNLSDKNGCSNSSEDVYKQETFGRNNYNLGNVLSKRK